MKERDYDVIVYGAGPEGVAAALAAAEHSGTVLLVDEGPDLGGSAVCGLLNCWRGDGQPALMEHLRKLTRRAWGRLIYEPEELARVFQSLLHDGGVDLLLSAKAVRVKSRIGEIKSVSFAGPEGRVKLSAWCYVDASQDGALTRLAGCSSVPDAEATAITVLARVGGIDTRVAGVFDHEVLSQYIAQFQSEQAADELPAGLAFPELVPCLRGGTAILNAAGAGIPIEEGSLGRTKAELKCRTDALAAIGFLQRNVPGYENCHLIHFAGQALVLSCQQPIRRRPESAVEVDSGLLEDVAALRHVNPENSAEPLVTPLGNLMCRDLENLLLARAESLTAEQLPMLLACGQAAGTIAAEAVLYDGCISKLDESRVRKALAENSGA